MTLFNYSLDPNILLFGSITGLAIFMVGSTIKNIWFKDSSDNLIIGSPTTDSGVDTIRALSADVNNPSPTLHYFTPEQLSTIQSSTDLNEGIINNNLVDKGVQTINDHGLNIIMDQVDLINLSDSPILKVDQAIQTDIADLVINNNISPFIYDHPANSFWFTNDVVFSVIAKSEFISTWF